jgi:hypothetical protein
MAVSDTSCETEPCVRLAQSANIDLFSCLHDVNSNMDRLLADDLPSESSLREFCKWLPGIVGTSLEPELTRYCSPTRKSPFVLPPI